MNKNILLKKCEMVDIENIFLGKIFRGDYMRRKEEEIESIMALLKEEYHPCQIKRIKQIDYSNKNMFNDDIFICNRQLVKSKLFNIIKREVFCFNLFNTKGKELLIKWEDGVCKQISIFFYKYPYYIKEKRFIDIYNLMTIEREFLKKEDYEQLIYFTKLAVFNRNGERVTGWYDNIWGGIFSEDYNVKHLPYFVAEKISSNFFGKNKNKFITVIYKIIDKDKVFPILSFNKKILFLNPENFNFIVDSDEEENEYFYYKNQEKNGRLYPYPVFKFKVTYLSDLSESFVSNVNKNDNINNRGEK